MIILLILIPAPVVAEESLKIYVNNSEPYVTTARFVRESLRLIGIPSEVYYTSLNLPDDMISNTFYTRDENDFDMIIGSLEIDPFLEIPSLSWLFDNEYEPFNLADILYNSGKYFSKKMEDKIIGSNFLKLDELIDYIEEFNILFMQELYSIPLFNSFTEYRSDINYNYSLFDNIRMKFIDNDITINRIDDELISDPLLYIDNEYQPHPALAYQFIDGDIGFVDLDNDITTPAVRAYEYRFFIRDVPWRDVTIDGINYSRNLNANDFALSLTAIQNRYNIPMSIEYSNSLFDISEDYKFPELLGYNVTSTFADNDTLSVYIAPENIRTDTLIKLADLRPLHYDIFRNNLWEFTPFLDFNLFKSSYNKIEDSIQWKQLINQSGLLGAFEYNGSYIIKSDYYYPNKNDVLDYYDSNKAIKLEIFWQQIMDEFAPHMMDNNISYWEDTWPYKISINSSTNEGMIYNVLDNKLPLSIYFNMNNRLLQNRDVREAIALSIDRRELSKLYSNVVYADSPLPYNIHGKLIEYNLEKAIALLSLNNNNYQLPFVLVIIPVILISKKIIYH